MAPNPRRVLERIRVEVWERIPTIPSCTGACWDSCGPVQMSHVEKRATAEAGHEVPTMDEMAARGCEWCPALSPMKRCMVYDARPTICRLWGAVEALPCVHGCMPEGGRLANEVGFELLRLALEIGGWPPGWNPIAADEFAALMSAPDVRVGMAAIARGEVPIEVALHGHQRRMRARARGRARRG